MLTATDLVFRAGGRPLIDRVSARFEPGRLHLILGPNGAGKSTLIRLLARLLRAGEGTILYDGLDAAHWRERDLARRRAVLSQAIEVAFSIPVRELVLMGRYPHFGARPGADDLAICDEVMRFFDVTGMADRSYGTLSGGERQRVQFARVLAQIWRPLEGTSRYLFLDEPLTFLDIRHQIDFMEKVRVFASQKDVVVVGVVHDLNLAVQFADRLLLLDHGRVLADGSSAEVLTEDHLQTAFAVTPVLLTNPATGKAHLVFESGGDGMQR
ncbi:MAG TPA: heme ABC transporter ATP-binding protein [Acidobacteriaceae bacterium]|jgi:iron complex transport system ATP-binding protein|nr:heme ABC transporter ATP-binding protein [Acidobacteriaceae bacterium]